MTVASSTTMPNSEQLEDPASHRFLVFARTRDAAVLDQLIAEHLDRAYAQARCLLCNNAEAEDAVQDAFLHLVRSAPSYTGSIPFGAWLGRLVHNSSIDIVRSRNRRKRREVRAAAVQVPPSERHDLPTEAVRAAVQDLPERYRATVDLHYFGGLSQRDTAKALGLQENAVAKRLERAREYLRALLQRRGVAVTGAAIAGALAIPSGHAAPAALAGTIQAAAMATTGTSVSVGMAAASATFSSAKVAALVLAGISLAGAGTWVATKAHADPSQRIWDFNTGSSAGIGLESGSWHAVQGLGPEGSTCMEMDSPESDLALDYALDDGPLLMTWVSQPIASPPPDGFSTTPFVRSDLVALFWNIGPGHDLKNGWESFRCYIDHDRIDVWCGEERTNFMWLSGGHGQVGLRFRGIYRLDQIEIRRISSAELPPARELIDAIEAIPPAARRGEVPLPQLTSKRPPQPVRASFLHLQP